MNKIITKRIRRLRVLKGYSQEYVAGKLCISQSAYARLESGETNSWAIYLEKICQILDIPIEKLIYIDNIIPGNEQKCSACDNALVIYKLTEKLIEHLEKRIEEKDNLLKHLKKSIKIDN